MTVERDSSPRQRTRSELFELIRNRGEVTRSELIALTGMPRSTVNQSIGRLFAEGRIVEVDVEPKGPGSGSGRPSTRLRAVVAGGSVAGIDFGHSHVHVALGDEQGSTIAVAQAELDVDLCAAEALDAAADLLAGLQAEHGIGSLSAVVAGIPGPLDHHAGVVRSPTILSGWVGLAPAEELGRRIGVQVHAENDAVLGAFGELRRGAGRPFQDFLYIKASHGIGAAMIVDGQPYRGATGLAGEIGHTLLPGQFEPCRCGNRGCLEAVVSVRTVRQQIAHTRPGVDVSSLDLATLDDPIAARILDGAGRTLGKVLADLCNLLNPAAIVVGGELGRADGALIAGIRASLRLHAQPATLAAMQVLAAELGTGAELTGALQLAAMTPAR